MGMKKIFLVFVVLAAILQCNAFAVIDPVQGIATPNGQFVFVPNQTGTYSIKVVKTSDDSVASTRTVPSGWPVSMVVSPNGNTLFVVAASGSGARVRSYTIDYTLGALNPVSYLALSMTSATAGRQCAISPDGRYLYVANYDNDPTAGQRVYILDVSNPAAMSVLNTVQVASNLWGIAMKPDGTRLYVGSRNPSAYAVYTYDISGVYGVAGNKKASPTAVPGATISLGASMEPTYLAVNTNGDRLFVRVFQTVAPADGARKDVLVYDISVAPPSRIAGVYKIKGNNYRSDLPGNHMPPPSGYDLDQNSSGSLGNAFDGMALSPNGWFMYFGHYNGSSEYAGYTYRETLYGSSISELGNGFDRTNSGDIWVQYGGYGTTETSPVTPIWGGWHSSDGVIAARTPKHKVYMTYSDGSVTPEYITVETVAIANASPMAPVIIYPLPGDTDVGKAPNIYARWNDAVDDTPATSLSYRVEAILKSDLESGSSNWFLVNNTAAGVTSTHFYGMVGGQEYYLRVRAWDGAYTGPWAYTGPFKMYSGYISPPNAPGWLSNYNTTTTQSYFTWEAVSGATQYQVEYTKKTRYHGQRARSHPRLRPGAGLNQAYLEGHGTGQGSVRGMARPGATGRLTISSLSRHRTMWTG